MLSKMSRKAMLLGLTVSGLSACYVEVADDTENEQSQGSTRITHPDTLPPALRGEADTCEEQTSEDGSRTWHCFKSDDFQWRTSCKSESCQEVQVYTHYMLENDLGGGRVVHVEAFDNQYFQGAPTGSVRIANFDANRGEWRNAQLFLEPGEYYLRAYLSTDDDAVVPYSLGGMTLVQDQPVGVYGALSGAEMIRVAPRHQDRYPDPVHIYLDKLFEKPGAAPDTNAHLRINLQVADGLTIPDARQVIVRLHTDRDLAKAPAAQFTMASELLLIQGRVGKAEFVSPSLKTGDYIVFAFLDASGNGSYDVGEPAQVHTVNAQPAAVRIVKDRTESLAMILSDAPVDAQP